MRYISCLIMLLFWSTAASAMPIPVGTGDVSGRTGDTTKGAANAINAFALDLYSQLASGDANAKNLFFSPYSISTALAMTYAGAEGKTAEEMAKVLHFDAVSGDVHASMKALRERFAAMPENTGTLDVANRLWMAAEAKVLPAFTTLLNQNYGSAAKQLDFAKDSEGACATINAWVAEKTHDKIKDLLRQGDVKPSTRLVLTNAIYFNSAWLTPFSAAATKEEPFHTGAKTRKNVPMMHRTDFFPYREYLDLQIVKIPYRLPGFSLMILLPRVNGDFTQLGALEKQLTPTQFAAWTEGMERQNVALSLPKFRDEERYPLKDALEKLGMTLPFTPDANFSKMVEDNDVMIDAVIHQAVIDLDEKGTEAAAATAAIMGLKATRVPDPKEPVEFRADHPFVYCIVDDITGTILFMGRMMEP